MPTSHSAGVRSGVNHLGQPIGPPVPGWKPPPAPPRSAMEGRFCRVEPLEPGRHAAELYAANFLDTEGRNWTYLPYGPFATLTEYRAVVEQVCLASDPLFHAIIDRKSGQAVGVASYLRIAPGD